MLLLLGVCISLVFCSVVGGLETLKAMEEVPTDEDDRPTREILIREATVFADPFAKDEEEQKRAAAAASAAPTSASATGSSIAVAVTAPSSSSTTSGTTTAPLVGQYLVRQQQQQRPQTTNDKDGTGAKQAPPALPRPSVPGRTGFGDFSGW